MAHSDYEKALNFLFARTTGAFKFGLERTSALLSALGDPHLAVPCLHVAGTNGKGSSVASAAAMLRSRGLRVATYTSPHLVDFRERIVVDGEAIPAAAIIEFIERHTPRIEQIGASFFEATTAMAFDYIARASADVSVIEAGLGGRLDSTNVVDPRAAGVTSIGRDHTEYLGDTLEAIAGEKAGIFKPGRPAVIGEQNPALRRLLARLAGEHGATPVRSLADQIAIEDIMVDRIGTRFTIQGESAVTVTTPLVGRHQAGNAAFAWLLLDAAGPPFAVSLSEAAVALSSVRLPGRFDQVGRLVFDVAHNPDGAKALAETLRLVAPEPPVIALFSVLGDKDWRTMLDALSPVVEHFIATIAPSSPTGRIWSLTDVSAFAKEQKISLSVEQDFEAALEQAIDAGRTTLITGSFHTVGDAMSLLHLSPLAR